MQKKVHFKPMCIFPWPVKKALLWSHKHKQEARKHKALHYCKMQMMELYVTLTSNASYNCAQLSKMLIPLIMYDMLWDGPKMKALTWVRTPSASASAGLVGVMGGRVPTGSTLSSSLSTFALPLDDAVLSCLVLPQLGLPFSHPGECSLGWSTSGSSSSSEGLVVTLASGELLGRSTITHSLVSMSCFPELRLRATNPPVLTTPAPCSWDPDDAGLGESPPDRNSSSKCQILSCCSLAGAAWPWVTGMIAAPLASMSWCWVPSCCFAELNRYKIVAGNQLSTTP